MIRQHLRAFGIDLATSELCRTGATSGTGWRWRLGWWIYDLFSRPEDFVGECVDRSGEEPF